MKVSLQGRYIEDILPYFESKDFKITNRNPDLIIVHGGDGALLGAEREFPGIPKFPVRDIRTAPLCPEHSSYGKIFALLAKNKLAKSEIMKISASNGSFGLLERCEITSSAP